MHASEVATEGHRRLFIVIPPLYSTIQSLSFIIHNPARLLSKSEVKETTSGILLMSIDVFSCSCSKTIVVFDTSNLLLSNCSQQSGRNLQ